MGAAMLYQRHHLQCESMQWQPGSDADMLNFCLHGSLPAQPWAECSRHHLWGELKDGFCHESYPCGGLFRYCTHFCGSLLSSIFLYSQRGKHKRRKQLINVMTHNQINLFHLYVKLHEVQRIVLLYKALAPSGGWIWALFRVVLWSGPVSRCTQKRCELWNIVALDIIYP